MAIKANGKLNYNLQDFDEAVDALGGIKEVARITRRSPSQVCQWRNKFGAFPPEHYRNISKALIARGFGGPLHLFKFEPPTE